MTDIADRLFKLVSLPDIVVVVEAGIEKIFARRSNRNRQNNSFSRESVKQDVLLLDDTIMAIKHVQRIPKANTQLIVLDVDEDDVETVVEKAVSFVQARLARA